jgi:pimeloyl-ACP methyl ester carboxylesterase
MQHAGGEPVQHLEPQMRTRLSLPTFLLLCSCASSPKTADDAGNPTPDSGLAPMADAGQVSTDAGEVTDAAAPDAAQPTCPTIDGEVVQLTTQDGLTLEADLYTTGNPGAPAAVLLHMIPPSNTRSNYPQSFISALTDRGITVLNVDRRGAGGDPALARTAYTGPDGKWDAKAAIDFLLAHPCAPSSDRIALVGASNGTTTAFDYAVYAVGAPEAPAPAALVFLTGGTYTETNNQFTAQRAVLDSLPIQFVFSTAERAWSAGKQGSAATTWVFEEYAPGDHGTRMFNVQAPSITAVADFLQSKL